MRNSSGRPCLPEMNPAVSLKLRGLISHLGKTEKARPSAIDLVGRRRFWHTLISASSRAMCRLTSAASAFDSREPQDPDKRFLLRARLVRRSRVRFSRRTILWLFRQ